MNVSYPADTMWQWNNFKQILIHTPVQSHRCIIVIVSCLHRQGDRLNETKHALFLSCSNKNRTLSQHLHMQLWKCVGRKMFCPWDSTNQFFWSTWLYRQSNQKVFALMLYIKSNLGAKWLRFNINLLISNFCKMYEDLMSQRSIV